MASFSFASESSSRRGIINVPRPDPTPGDDPTRCRGSFFHSFSIHFCNIRGLRSNFHSVEHHFSSSKPRLLFLTNTQVSEATDSNLYSVLSYFLYPQFHSKAGCCVYVRNDITCSRAHQLDSSEFSTIWLKVNSHSFSKYICAINLSPNSTNYIKFFDVSLFIFPPPAAAFYISYDSSCSPSTFAYFSPSPVTPLFHLFLRFLLSLTPTLAISASLLQPSFSL